MDSNARVDVHFAKVDVNFQMVTVTLFPYRFFHSDIIKHQGPTNTPNKTSARYTKPFWRNVDFIGFASFSYSCHLGLSTRLNFTILKAWCLIMLHVNFEIHGCSGSRKYVI